MIERTELPSGLSITRVLTGLWQIADMERGGKVVDPELGAAAMERYATAGLSTFDMADHYGSAELIAGHYRASRGERLPLQALTKWVPEPGPVTREATLAAVNRARERLRTERIDLLQFHTWTYDDPSWLDALFHLDELRREGLIGGIGLTNVDTAHLRMALDSGLPIATNQVSFSLLDRRAARDMLALCRERGVGLLAYGTLAGGLLSERWLGRPEPEWGEATPWSWNKYRRFVAAVGGWQAYQAVLHAAANVAKRQDVSVANVASRFVLDTPGVAGVIIGARLGESEHIGDTLRLFELRLSQEDVEELNAAIAGLEAVPGDCGDEYRKPPFLTASGDLSHHLQSMPAPYPSRAMPGGRRICSTGTVWEEVAGYARAMRIGERVLVSGTTAMHRDRLIGGEDPASQTHFVIDKIEGALRSLGAGIADVVRTRIYLASEADADAVSRAHGQRFGAIMPANTLVVAGLVGSGQRVEIEAEAVLSDPPATAPSVAG